MSYANVMLTCTTIKPEKSGILRPDGNGYYTMPVGGLNCYNSAGQYYDCPDAVKRLFDDSSDLMRKIRKGDLYGENGHPVPEPGMTDDQFLMRARTIQEKRTCAHFSEVWLDDTRFKSDNGTPIIAIMAKVKPYGELKHVLEDSLNNPKADTCFSIRGFTIERWVGRVKYKTLIEIINWDLVHEPGISHATKYHAPALEARGVSMEAFSLQPIGEDFSWEVTRACIEKAKQSAHNSNSFGLSTESAVNDINKFEKLYMLSKPEFIKGSSSILSI